MSMSTYIQGLKPKTKEYEKKLQIYKLCKETGVLPPKEIEDYFDGEICEEGIITELPEESIREYDDLSCREFHEVDLTKIPLDVVKIRFVNSY